MGSATPALAILYSIRAQKDLDGIWEYNAKAYASPAHANGYVNFLKTEIRKLATEPEKGRVVAINPKLRYLLMKWSNDGYGHIAVYRVTKTAIRVSRVLHTSQDWERKVKPRSR